MNRTLRYLSACFAALLLAGCSTESDSDWNQQDDVVRIAASVGTTTRTLPDGATETEQQQFVNNDKIAVEATYTINGTNETKSVQYQYADGQWNGVDGNFLTWRKKASAFQFKSFYPADGTNSLTAGHVYADQTTTAAMAKSDYMTATVNPTTRPADCMLRLDMDRQTARLILNIKKIATEFPAGTKIDHVVVVSSKDIPATSQQVEISPKQQGDGGETTTYTALVSPGAIAVKIYMTADGTPLTTKTATLEKGKSYTYDLTVGKTKIDIEGIKVNDWNNGEAIDGGKATPPPYVTFTAEGEQIFKMTTVGNYTISGLEYSVSGGEWTSVKANEAVSFGGDKGNLQLRGTNINGTADAVIDVYKPSYSRIEFTDNDVPVACTGDIRTLLDWKNYKTVNTEKARFSSLFEECKALTSAPELPATKLADYCYSGMFSGCKNLETAPELPATKLTDYCYSGMFHSCEKLETAPKLPATELASNCYSYMFYYCTKLKEAPELRATTLAKECYYYMFFNCNLETAPALPATQLADWCYCYMFYYCTNLKTAPRLSAEKLAQGCYYGMFRNCTNLSSVTMLAPSDQITSTSKCCYRWLNDTRKDAASRTLILKDETAYNALASNSDYLPDNWKKGQCDVSW